MAQNALLRYVSVVPKLTRTRVDKLGYALAGSPTDEDRDLYFELREAYVPAFSDVEEHLRRWFPDHPPVGRLKTLDSVRAKLIRKTTRRLSTMQDIAGSRLVFENGWFQNMAVDVITQFFGDARVEDLRGGSPTDYRAVHVIVEAELAGSLKGQVEIQVRTALQDDWAQLSEILADRYDDQIKHGPTSGKAGTLLATLSDIIRSFEEMECEGLSHKPTVRGLAEMNARRHVDPDGEARIQELKGKIRRMIREALQTL